MRTAIDPYASPDSFLGNQASCDLARFYGLPSWSYAGMSDSKLLDEQWALELGLTTLLGALSRATLLHDVGDLESGLQSSFESLVLGDEIAGYARSFMRELSVDDSDLAIGEILEVGPGGNHLSRRFTRQNYRLLWRTSLLDQNPYERWSSSGSSRLIDRVRMRVSELRSNSQEPLLDDALMSRLEKLCCTVLE